MRVVRILAVLSISGTFLSGTLSVSQDKPLGDVARDARAQKLGSPPGEKSCDR